MMTDMTRSIQTGNDPMTARRVLVLEDDADLCRLFSRALRASGYEVYPATTLDEARALLIQIPMHAFLCDVHVGSECGTDLLREQLDTLRQHGTQVIMVSGEAQYRPFCEEMGVDFYLEKPVAIGALVKLVDRLTGQPRA
jgi:DNA-binding response OmpR family regulator